jgi:hypothetical protein
MSSKLHARAVAMKSRRVAALFFFDRWKPENEISDPGGSGKYPCPMPLLWPRLKLEHARL